MITNKISSTLCTERNTVGLDFNNNNMADSEYRLLDSIFNFGFEFAITSNSKERSSVFNVALRDIPDARLLLLRQLENGAVEVLDMDCLTMVSAEMPRECVLSYSALETKNFVDLDRFGEFLNTVH